MYVFHISWVPEVIAGHCTADRFLADLYRKRGDVVFQKYARENQEEGLLIHR